MKVGWSKTCRVMTSQSASLFHKPHPVPQLGAVFASWGGGKIAKLMAFVSLHTSKGLSWRMGATGGQNQAPLLCGPIKVSAAFGIKRVTWRRLCQALPVVRLG